MNEMILVPKSIEEARALSATLAKSMLLPEAYRGKEADVLLTIMSGAEMGLGPAQSLRAFDVIKGKPALKAEAMVAIVRSSRNVEFVRCIETTPQKATWESKFRDSAAVLRSTFTLADAQTAGLTGQDMYKRWPARMLLWRCASLHCKTHHSDLILGLYSDEEASSFERDATPAPAAPQVVEAKQAVEAVKAKAKARLFTVPETPEVPAPPPTPEPPPPTDADFVPTGVTR